MKTFTILILCVLLISCENTGDPPNSTYSMVGTVNVKLIRVHESGRVLGYFQASYYLAGLKVELLHKGKIIQTTKTINDGVANKYYIFNNLEFNKTYSICITLNDLMKDTTEEFAVKEEYLTPLFPDNLYGILNLQDTSKKFYTSLLYDYDNNIIFDLYTDRGIFSIIPNPLLNYGNMTFSISESANVEIELIEIQNKSKIVLFKNYLQAGEHQIAIDSTIADGLYYCKLTINDKKYYCPFIKGKNGTPIH